MNRLLAATVAAGLLSLGGCSSGGNGPPPPPPVGKYSNASLNGTYAFMTSGEVFVNGNLSPAPLQRVGSFVANGTGGITGGIEDVNSQGIPSGAQAITGGSYSVNADGRGTLTLQFATNTLTFGIVLTSTSDGLMMDETNTLSATGGQASTGSGNFIKQDPTVCSNPVGSVAGTYTFDFTGLDSASPPNPESFVGKFTANNGVTTANFADLNDSLTLSNGVFTMNFGTDGLTPAGPNACGRGLAQMVIGATAETYAYYVVDATRVRFINSAGGEMLSGDAVLQDNTIPTNANNINSGFVFLVAGATQNGGLTRLGRFTAGGGNLTSLLMDTNDPGQAGFVSTTGAANATITLDAANPGRGTISFVGTGQSVNVPSSFVFYLSSATQGVLQETTHNLNTGAVVAVADGSIVAQTGGPFSGSNITGTYALNWSGQVTRGGSFANQDEEDVLGQVTVKSLALSGASDAFQFTSTTLTPNLNLATGGTINLNGGDGTGADKNRVFLDVTPGNQSAVHMVAYIASPQLAFFANRDNNGAPRIVAGIVKTQQ